MPASKTTTKKRTVKRSKKTKTTTPAQVVAAAPEPTPAPAPVQVAAPAPASTAEESTSVDTWKANYERVTSLQIKLAALVKELNSELKSLKKRVDKEMKQSAKKRKKTSSAKRAPSGFAKPTRISGELCDFLGKPKGTEMARTEVTKLLTQYVRDHNLQDPNNKRTIVPDARLKKLLNVGANDTVTYFNLQKHMKPHFPKTSSAASSTA